MTERARQPENDVRNQTLLEMFNGSVDRYSKSFPEKLANLYITYEETPIYVSPEIVARLSKSVDIVRAVVAARAADMVKAGTSGMAGKAFIGGGHGLVDYISFRRHKDGIYVSKNHPQKINNIGLFDHEMGHLLVKEGRPSRVDPHRAECAADAFAALRHIQRFGDTADIFNHAPGELASTIFTETPSIHYTSAVIQKIADLHRSRQIDIPALSLQEIVDLAGKIARNYALPSATLNRINKAYKPVKALYDEDKTDQIALAKEIIRVMNDHKNNSDIYRAGRLLLNRTSMKPTVAHLVKHDDDFQRTRALLLHHEKETGFILNAAREMDKKRAAGGKPKPRIRIKLPPTGDAP